MTGPIESVARLESMVGRYVHVVTGGSPAVSVTGRVVTCGPDRWVLERDVDGQRKPDTVSLVPIAVTVLVPCSALYDGNIWRAERCERGPDHTGYHIDRYGRTWSTPAIRLSVPPPGATRASREGAPPVTPDSPTPLGSS